MKIRTIPLVCLLAALVLGAGCAPALDAPATGDAAGFWRGLWHGFTLLFTFAYSLFADGVGIYQPHNNGNLYNLGYLLGVMMFFGGSSGGACKKVCEPTRRDKATADES